MEGYYQDGLFNGHGVLKWPSGLVY
ncbi:hypothetical protein [Thermodesulfobium fumaratoxidans]